MSTEFSQDQTIKDAERHFHDAWASSVHPSEVMVDESWEASTCPEHRWIREQLGTLKGKRILDLGCGAGEAAVWFAKQGAHAVASDLSPEFLALVAKVAQLNNVKVDLHLADADQLELAAESFDVVYAGNVLHHVNLEETLDRIRRV